nr:RsiV family protein [uncultured Chryseobacterium sp.]
MKNTVAVLALTSFFAFTACKKNEPTGTATEKTETKKSDELAIDSVKVNDSTKITDSLTVTFTSKFLVFPGLKDKRLLDSIYFHDPKIKDFSKAGLQGFLENQKKEYFNSVKNDNKDWVSDITYAQNWYSSSHMYLKSNINGYMHIEYVGSSYIGGAHDEYGFSERVFDLKNNKKLELKDITSMPKNKIEAILMKNINKINSGTSDENGEVKNSEMLLVDKIPVSDNFYFDDKNLYFHYSPYEIAAFAAGDITIPVSWDELDGTLSTEFKERMKIK